MVKLARGEYAGYPKNENKISIWAECFPFISMKDQLKPIEEIGTNRCIEVNNRGCVVIAVNEDGGTVEYYSGGKEIIKFGTLINPLEAPMILVSWY